MIGLGVCHVYISGFTPRTGNVKCGGKEGEGGTSTKYNNIKRVFHLLTTVNLKKREHPLATQNKPNDVYIQ